MRLQLILPRVKPGEIEVPVVCPYDGCEGRHFRHHQEVDKSLKDTQYGCVTAHRYECLRKTQKPSKSGCSRLQRQ